MKEILLYFSLKSKGDQYQIYKNIKNGTSVSLQEVSEFQKKLIENNINYKTILDDDYPKELYQVNDCMFLFYYKGNYDLINQKYKFYIVNELWEAYNWEIINKNINTLVNEVVLVTNNYKKTESQFVDFFRNKGGCIIHLAKEGLDSYNYDKINLEKELVISQYPLQTHPEIKYFKQANFIASALSNCLLSLSIKKESKSNNLITSFLNLGKDVFCFPGREINDGNNQLIDSGANLILSISKVINI
ncbi:DNA processing protein [Mycoplasmopsis mustelae]|uniref:DNA processing protein n=1 Tax=Mycoplasmopsis mustelae TaxID=171289 RepID=A0A4R7UC08_9BACT|nr:DNA-processing protein DprA [Mycoplasmopsis mustelae]TDV23256.1 DNA processing protein [Mycoplasmopsis mustelae]